ncbi:MAG: T9SS type A sorting domain-containing protein [Bacteroidetes bacterium]|nr:T9SS type A sorting domain-containing protein [Bacteroidota bacterium]
MKQNKFLFTLLFLLLVRIFLAQVTTVCIPTNTVNAAPSNTVSVQQTEHRKPLGTYFGYERTAIIFSASEIGMLGQITGIAVYCDSMHLPGNVPLTVYIKEVSDSFFVAPTTESTETLSATAVFKDTLSDTIFAKNKWINIPFSTPFTHATNRAVELIFETNAGGTGSEGISGKFFSHYKPGSNLYVSQFWNADNAPPTINGTITQNRPNVQLTLSAISTCSNTPSAGHVTLLSADSLCLNQTTSMSLTGGSAASGLTYQWQQSFDGLNFANLSGAVYSTLTASLSANTWFRCSVTCLASGQTSYSDTGMVFLKPFTQCYCTNLGGGCSGGTTIDSVAIEGTSLINPTGGCPANNYTLFPSSGNTTTALNQQSTYVLDTRFGGNVVACFWIDFNRNGILENSEWKSICLQSPTGNPDSLFRTSFSVPTNANIGFTLMRIRTRASGNANDTTTTCSPFGSGETEDYYVYIDYPMGIKNIENPQTSFKIYPNPATENIQIQIERNASHTQELFIYDMLGNELKKIDCKQNNLSVNISTLPQGVYFIRIGTSTQKFIKQ